MMQAPAPRASSKSSRVDVARAGATAADSWTPFCAFVEYWEACPTGGLPHKNENRRRAANGTDECGEMGDVD